mmetsp:Transcript_26180/g.71829  ORF Transcript_26180/g.71829 Transcript_26180/m.71829 type:complete len:221 (-) Transcript_26180:74-736(-)
MVLLHAALQARPGTGSVGALGQAVQARPGRNRRLRRGHAPRRRVPLPAGGPPPRERHGCGPGRSGPAAASTRPQAPKGGGGLRRRQRHHRGSRVPLAGTRHDGSAPPVAAVRIRRGHPRGAHRGPPAHAAPVQAGLLRSGLRTRTGHGRQHGCPGRLFVPTHGSTGLGGGRGRKDRRKWRFWRWYVWMAHGQVIREARKAGRWLCCLENKNEAPYRKPFF